KNNTIIEWKPDQEELQRCYTAITSRVSGVDGIIPSDHSTAVIIAAMKYGIDLSYAKSPLLEYRYLSSNPSSYIPLDEKMKHVTKISPESYRLSSFYNPILPRGLYTSPLLFSICHHIDLTGISRYSSAEQYIMEITSSIYTDRFYRGIHPAIKDI